MRDNDEQNDGSRMALDENGNPRGGIRTPYVDVPMAKYGIRPPRGHAADPEPERLCRGRRPAGREPDVRPQRHADPVRRGEAEGAVQDTRRLRRAVEKRVKELEKAGWSLPVYRDLIVADAQKVRF